MIMVNIREHQVIIIPKLPADTLGPVLVVPDNAKQFVVISILWSASSLADVGTKISTPVK